MVQMLAINGDRLALRLVAQESLRRRQAQTSDPAWHEPMIREAEQNGNAFAAIWHLDRLIAARLDDWLLYARRARAWASSEKFDKAASDYQQAGRLSSRDQVLAIRARLAAGFTRATRGHYRSRSMSATANDSPRTISAGDELRFRGRITSGETEHRVHRN